MIRTAADILGDRLRIVLALTEVNSVLRLALSQSNGARLDLLNLEQSAEEETPDPVALADARSRNDLARARMARAEAHIATLDAELEDLDRELASLPAERRPDVL